MPDERDYLIHQIMSGVAQHSQTTRSRYMAILADVELASTDALRRILGGGKWTMLAKVRGLEL